MASRSLRLAPSASPLDDAVLALCRAFDDGVRGIVLFGSRARGDARSESDWDLLIVADPLPESPLERSRRVSRALPARWQGRIAVMAKTATEFETEFPSYYLDLAVDGQILFDREGYLEERLALIRQRIREAGLSREKLGQGFLWTWKTPPRGRWRIDWSGAYGLGGGR